jgi:hypothetical protein
LALNAAVVGRTRRFVDGDVMQGVGEKGQGATVVVGQSLYFEVPIAGFDLDLRVRNLTVEAVAESHNHRQGSYMVASKLGTVANCSLELLDTDKAHEGEPVVADQEPFVVKTCTRFALELL